MKYRDPRRVTDFPAIILVDGERRAVEIREISRSGVKVAGLPDGLDDDAGGANDLTLSVLNHRVACQVRWQSGDLAGLKLAMPLPKSVTDKVRRRGGHAGSGARYYGH